MPLTLMAVHAHPDDEVISTGGTLARYAQEGIRTVVVTCTDGSQGFGPGGVLPDSPATTSTRWPPPAVTSWPDPARPSA